MTSSVHYVLAIDLGTSGPKVALVSEQGAIAAHAARRVKTRFLPPSGAEQDPREIWEAIRSAIHEVVERAAVPRDTIVAVGCASQYFSIVPVDAQGDAVAPLLLWMDGRGGPNAMALHGEHPDAFERWLEIHGIPPLPSGSDSLSKILWVRDECPEVWEKTHCFLEPVDWVLMRLTGRCTANACSAFSMLLTDCRHPVALEWDAELLGMARVDREKLPQLVAPNSVIGPLRPAIAADLGLRPATQVLSGTNDTQAAAVATATFLPGTSAVNVGTTGQVLVHFDSRKADFLNALISMPSPIAGRYMLMAENGIAAKALDHFLGNVIFTRDALADHANADPFAGVEQAAYSAPAGAGGLLFLPALTGTVAPDGNPNARGAFVNITLETDRARMMRAILEGVAYGMRALMPAVEALAGDPLAEMRFSGGGARSDAWAQIFADVLQKPILPLVDPAHSNNRASALLAFDALGMVSVNEVDRFCPVRGRFEPQIAHRGIYDELFAQFRAAYEGLRPVFEALNTPGALSRPT